MKIYNRFDFSKYVSMKIGAAKEDVYWIDSPSDLYTLLQQHQGSAMMMLGACTNTVIGSYTEKQIFIINHILGIDIIEDNPKDVLLKIGAGETLDEVISKTLEMGFVGLESLSIIPGTIGAAPVQNAGAYGSEIGDTLEKVIAYDTIDKKEVTLSHDDLELGYRTSIFNTTKRNRYMILYVFLRLEKGSEQALVAAKARREEVIAIRNSKIPDYTQFPSAGSFFRNPFIAKEVGLTLQKSYDDLILYPGQDEDTVKISAGWLIKKTYPNGALLYGLRIDPHHPLILCNESLQSEMDLYMAAQAIIAKVQQKFNITLHPEVNLIGITNEGHE